MVFKYYVYIISREMCHWRVYWMGNLDGMSGNSIGNVIGAAANYYFAINSYTLIEFFDTDRQRRLETYRR